MGLGLKVPSCFRQYGFFLAGLGIIAIFWAESAFGMFNSPSATAVLVSSIVLLAMSVSLFYERRTWCRYLCPLGGLAGILSSSSVLELRSNYGICTNDCKKHECYTGTATTEGCPMFEAPFLLKSNLNCVLCGQCVKACPKRSTMLNLRLPGYELYSMSLPDVALVWLGTILMGTQIFRGFERAGYIAALEWKQQEWWVVSSVLILSCVAFATFFSRFAGRMVFGKSSEHRQNAQFIIYSLIPLAVAYEMSFHLGRLLTYGGWVPSVLGRQLGWTHQIPVFTALPSTVKTFGVLFILTGACVSAVILVHYVRSRHERGSAPHLTPRHWWPVLFFSVLYIWFILVS
jgi:NAD-dependent dihydropyrimidine dehydrogenase PreA subunit